MNTKLIARSVFFAVVTFLLSLLPVSCIQDQEQQVLGKGHQDSVSELPEVVRSTLRREIPNLAEVRVRDIEIDKESESGHTIYEIELKVESIEYELDIAEDGALVEKQMEWQFDKDKAGSVPRRWSIAETNGKGRLAAWQVIRDDSAPSGSQVVAIINNNNSGQTYNLLMAEETNFKDLKIEVEVKAMSGQQDQGGGPIWRAKDADNYYIARWNPLEENLRVYFVKDGRRTQLASAEVKADPDKWHEIDIEHKGSDIEVQFDEVELIEIHDTTFPEAGMVGLWTKADAATAFDDFDVEIEPDN